MIYDPFRDGVSQGLLTMFQRCREETRLHVAGYSALRTSGALQFGSLAHIVLELIYGRKVLPDEKLVLKTIAEAVTEYKKEYDGRLSAEQEEYMEGNLALLEAVLPEYFMFWKSDFKKIKWAELEQKFSVPSPIAGVNVVGRIDGAFWVGKELWSFESKTKGRIEEDDITQQLPLDFQNCFYQRALGIKYKTRPRGSLYNIIRRPGHKQKQGESLVQFKNRVREEVKKDPKHFFIRFEVAVPKSDSDRFEQRLKIIMEEFIGWHKGTVKNYMNTTACLQKFGPCKFLPICANNEFSLFRKRDNIFPELARP